MIGLYSPELTIHIATQTPAVLANIHNTKDAHCTLTNEGIKRRHILDIARLDINFLNWIKHSIKKLFFRVSFLH